MDFEAGRQILAPNVWARDSEFFETVVRLADPPGRAAIAAAEARIDRALPVRHARFGPFSAEDAGSASHTTAWPRLLGQVALSLESRAREPATTRLHVLESGAPGVFRLAIEAHDPELADACLREAALLLERALSHDLDDLEPLVERLTDLADDVCVGPGTMLIVRAAIARDVPWRRLGRECLVQLGQGVRQRRIWTAVTDRTSSIAEGIASSKQLTKDVLAAAGVPVPLGRLVESPAEAWEAAQAVGLPVVVKPADGNHGRGVFLNLSTREEIESAFPVASDEGRRVRTVVVERFVPGFEHRLLVVGDRMVACAKGEHISITGDGRHTVAELIDLQINSDPRRGESAAMPNKTVHLDATVLAQLSQEGVTPETVPDDGRRVLVKRIGTHGLDATATVHPEMAAIAVRAARAIGLDIAGIDLIASDITRPPGEQGAAICEVNAGPQLMIHARPSSGPGQPVGEAVVDLLAATGGLGRIPIAAILTADGEAGAATARHLGRLLERAGGTPGVTCRAGKWVGRSPCSSNRCDTTDAARDLLVAPEIDAAVCQLDWRSLAERGFPFDRCDVVVLGTLPADGTWSGMTAATPTAVVEAFLDSLAPAGSIVLTGGDPRLAAVVARSGRDVVVVDPDGRPGTDGVHAPPRLAAVAAAVALGIDAETIRRGSVSD
ncbi:MAG: acetate--CoA ligase family protein [Planctomycetia bacterium]